MRNGHKIGALKRLIEEHIHPNNHRSDFYKKYGNWYIGVTNNTSLRKIQHIKSKQIAALHFKAWNAETKENALEVEKFFHLLGMRDKHGAGGVRDTTTWVYVFKIRTNIIDDLAHLLGRI